MPIPSDLDPVLVAFLLWLVVCALMLGAFAQLPKDDDYREKVSARTFRRLGTLNEYLNARFDEQWGKSPSQDIVPDLAALRSLKAVVDKAAVVDDRLSRRKSVADFGRFVLSLDIGLALSLGVAVFVFGAHDTLLLLARATAGVGLGVATLCFVSAAWLGWRVDHGQDF